MLDRFNPGSTAVADYNRGLHFNRGDLSLVDSAQTKTAQTKTAQAEKTGDFTKKMVTFKGGGGKRRRKSKKRKHTKKRKSKKKKTRRRRSRR